MMDTVVDPSAGKQGTFTNSGRIANRMRTVSFDGAFGVNYYCNFSTTPVGEVTMYYWNSADYAAAETLSPENATAALTIENVGDGQYKATIKGIAAKNLDQGFYVAFGYSDGESTYATDLQSYSIGTYCNSSVSKNISLSPLAAATAVYGYFAKSLFA